MNVHVGPMSRPTVRAAELDERALQVVGASDPCSHSIRSASARNPTVEYVPRTWTAPSHDL